MAGEAKWIGHSSAGTRTRFTSRKRSLGSIAALFAFGTLATGAFVATPSAGASIKAMSQSAGLEKWYQQTGRPTLSTFTADTQRFQNVTGPKQARQDCDTFKHDVIAAEQKKMPPGATSAAQYRYYLQAAATRFQECLTGISATNQVEMDEGAQGAGLAIHAVMTIIKGAKSGKLVNLPPSSTNIQPSLSPSVVVPQCYADFKSLEVALQAYNAANGAYPVPPAPWSAATYTGNFAPLDSSNTGSAWLNQNQLPGTTHYVIEYDSSGNVWVEPPGQFDASYNPAQGDYTDCAAVAK